MAFVIDMGRDLRARYDTSRDLELNKRPVILCKARAKSSASVNEHGIECSWGAAWPKFYGAITALKATFGPSLMFIRSFLLWVGCMLGLAYVSSCMRARHVMRCRFRKKPNGSVLRFLENVRIAITSLSCGFFR